MIVKDGAPVLARCLQSIAPFVDRLVIGDTGSKDDSPDLARSFGAEVFFIPWEQDFSRARNRLLAERRCDWVFVLDADEMLDPAGAAQIRELIQSPGVFAYHNPRWNYFRDMSARLGFQTAKPNPFVLEESRPYSGYVSLPTTRLFRGHSGVYYEGCVHETITKRLALLQLPTAPARFIVHHFGHVEDGETVRTQKDALYAALSEKKLEANPNDPQALIDLGLAELEHARRPGVAFRHFSRACRLSPQSAVAWLFSGACLVRLNRLPEALQCLDQAKALGLRNALLYQTLGDVHFHSGRYGNAREAYLRVAAMGEASPLSEAKLGACEVHLGLPGGIGRMQQATAAAPAFGELYDMLATGALLAGDLELASRTAEDRMRLGNTTEFHVQLNALLQEQWKQRDSKLAVPAMA